MGPKSLCFLFVSKGQSVAAAKGALRAELGAMPRAGGFAELIWGPAHSALFTLRPEAYNVC